MADVDVQTVINAYADACNREAAYRAAVLSMTRCRTIRQARDIGNKVLREVPHMPRIGTSVSG